METPDGNMAVNEGRHGRTGLCIVDAGGALLMLVLMSMLGVGVGVREVRVRAGRKGGQRCRVVLVRVLVGVFRFGQALEAGNW